MKHEVYFEHQAFGQTKKTSLGEFEGSEKEAIEKAVASKSNKFKKTDISALKAKKI